MFNQTKEISILSGSLNSIDGEIFRNLNKLLYFHINRIIFRKINHKQGIELIRQWNLGVNIHLTEISENKLKISSKNTSKRFLLKTNDKNTRNQLYFQMKIFASMSIFHSINLFYLLKPF